MFHGWINILFHPFKSFFSEKFFRILIRVYQHTETLLSVQQEPYHFYIDEYRYGLKQLFLVFRLEWNNGESHGEHDGSYECGVG